MRQIEFLRRDGSAFEKAMERAMARMSSGARPGVTSAGLESLPEGPSIPDVVTDVIRGSAAPESISGGTEAMHRDQLEAIVRLEMRPPYLIQDDVINLDSGGDSFEHMDALDAATLEKLGTASRSVGLIELSFHEWRNSAGTGWVIDKGETPGSYIVVTNRHVAQIFARGDGFGGYEFEPGRDRDLEARLNTLRQHETSDHPLRRGDVLRVLWIAADSEPDIAFVEVMTHGAPEPLDLSGTPLKADDLIAAVGYPARDLRDNDRDAFRTYFDGRFDVKRFSPGVVQKVLPGRPYVMGDYTSLGGSSGSAVLAIETGQVAGLHFAGAAGAANYFVPGEVVFAALRREKPIYTGATPALDTEAPTSRPDEMSGRNGYDPMFLGTEVPLPGLGAHAADLAPVEGAEDGVLRYTNFSVLQSKSRRLPRVAAVNIDGENAVRLKRKGTWRLDGRIQPEHQVGNELYKHNPLDRGHMVRRRDPGWGGLAQQAEIDTFHYTNCAPQHANLNQRDWVGLEDYILENAETRGFRATVFTGPVFSDEDRPLKDRPATREIPIPEEFWKVAVVVKEDGSLSATGYILSHGRMIQNLTEAAFVYGAYETYQVRIALIEAHTGYDFGPLRDADPLGARFEAEAPFGEMVRRIGAAADLVL